MKPVAKLFETEKDYELVKNLLIVKCPNGYFVDSKIDNPNDCWPLFYDTKKEIPCWSGEIAAEYFYNDNNELTDIIALW